MRTFPRASFARRFCLILTLGASHLFAGAAMSGPATAEPSRNQPRPATFEELRAKLAPSDRIAALAALSMALNQAGDGAIFAWKRHDSALRGVIKPTTAFRNADGRICRHVIYGLALGRYRKQIEVIACRAGDGRWRL